MDRNLHSRPCLLVSSSRVNNRVLNSIDEELENQTNVVGYKPVDLGGLRVTISKRDEGRVSPNDAKIHEEKLRNGKS